jgi:hypothetical protein
MTNRAGQFAPLGNLALEQTRIPAARCQKGCVRHEAH